MRSLTSHEFFVVQEEMIAHTEALGREVLPSWAEGLAGWEQGRFHRHRTAEARTVYAHAHLAARQTLERIAGEAITFAQRCSGCGGTDHGAPYVPGRDDLFLSISHSHRYVAVMAAGRPCGIDVQRVGRVPDRALTERERAYANDDLTRSQLWARKEAMIKAGLATMADVGTLDVLDPDPRVRDWEFDGELAGRVVGAWVVLD